MATHRPEGPGRQRDQVVPPERADGLVDQSEDRDEGSGFGWLWLIAGLILLLIAGGVFWFLTRPGDTAQSNPAQAPLIRAAPASEATRIVITQTGFVRPRAEVAVASQVSARIASVSEGFRLGGFVAQGDLILSLERDRFEADRARAEAGVQQAEAALAEAQLARQRQEELEDRNFASEAALQESIVAVATARANLAAARADLTQAEQSFSDTRITAPFDALVTEKNAAPGQLIGAGETVGTLVSADAAEIEMGLVEADLALLGTASRALGGEVRIRALSGEVLTTGVVTEVDPRIESETRTTALVVAVSDPFNEDRGRPLRVDELVELELPISIDGTGAVEIPTEGLKGGDIVWTVQDGALVRHAARVLRRSDDSAVIVSDSIAPGDTVMLSDLGTAFDGQEVRVADTPVPAEEGFDTQGAGTGQSARPARSETGAQPDSAPSGSFGTAADGQRETYQPQAPASASRPAQQQSGQEGGLQIGGDGGQPAISQGLGVEGSVTGVDVQQNTGPSPSFDSGPGTQQGGN